MKEFPKEINLTQQDFAKALQAIDSHETLEQLRVAYLGRQGKIHGLMQQLKKLSVDGKREIGPLLNTLKQECTQAFEQKLNQLNAQALEADLKQQEHFDVTAYTPETLFGSLHPMTLIIEHIEDVFISMGYQVVDGPEIETNFYNFEALNIPADHPARDMWDTFYLDVPDMLLRTHTSPVQIHAMEKKELPLAVIAPGRCYRHEATDASHDFVFMQAEGLLIDKQISISNLLATVKTFLKAIFETNKLEIRVRPSYFPFVEPGIEIDISCPFCSHGCSTCKQSKWIEISGAGLVHPHVLKSVNIDPKKYSGFAFGFGITRLAMLKYGISDIRLLHSAKIDFLQQF